MLPTKQFYCGISSVCMVLCTALETFDVHRVIMWFKEYLLVLWPAWGFKWNEFGNIFVHEYFIFSGKTWWTFVWCRKMKDNKTGLTKSSPVFNCETFLNCHMMIWPKSKYVRIHQMAVQQMKQMRVSYFSGSARGSIINFAALRLRQGSRWLIRLSSIHYIVSEDSPCFFTLFAGSYVSERKWMKLGFWNHQFHIFFFKKTTQI